MVESRCGILCSECGYKEQMNCEGCVHIEKPFWGDACPIKSCCEDKKLEYCGECNDFPCDILNGFAYDKQQGDDGKRIEQCKAWKKSLLNYEIVALTEKIVVGLSARTRNNDENCGTIIGGLWQRFFGDGVFGSIENKLNDKSIGLYSDYETDMSGWYDVTACCEVSHAKNIQNDIIVKTIPAGKYAKFVVHGHMQKAVANFWTKLWEMPLERAYGSDFEEYQSGGDIENAEIHMYIAIKSTKKPSR